MVEDTQKEELPLVLLAPLPFVVQSTTATVRRTYS